MRYEVASNGTKSNPWSLCLVLNDGNKVIDGYTKFRSQAACQDWADRMNKAAENCKPKATFSQRTA